MTGNAATDLVSPHATESPSPHATVTNAGFAARWESSVMGTYGTPPLTLVRGHGVRVTDADGREYLDMLAGIAVSSLGHTHPAVTAAVTAQVQTLVHTSNLAITPPAVALAARLVALVEDPGARVFFANSGAEAVEAALKVVRRHHPDRRHVVAAERAFHGRTLGALSVTGQPAKRAPFEPLLGPVTFVPYGDVDALRAAVTDETAAVLLEPVLGEAGVHPAPAGYLEAARQRCDDTGALLVLDEVQGGLGRAGDWFSHRVVAPGVRPDVITLAKGLGGGMPIGACVAASGTADALRLGDHGSTFGANPVCCAAALAVLDTIETEKLLDRSTEMGRRLVGALAHPQISEVRGVGLWRGIGLRADIAKDVETELRAQGVLVNAVGPDTIRLAPPLIVTEAEIDEFAAAFHAALDAVTSRDGGS